MHTHDCPEKLLEAVVVARHLRRTSNELLATIRGFVQLLQEDERCAHDDCVEYLLHLGAAVERLILTLRRLDEIRT